MWLQPLAERAATVSAEAITRFTPPDNGGRRSAVLVLLGENAPEAARRETVPGPDVLVLQRAARMRAHAGQPAFPGGASDPDDDGPAGTALREAHEEVGLDPASVHVVTAMPELWIPVTQFAVTPVLAWWREPHPVRPMAHDEVSRVERLPVAELVDPANRIRVRHPSGYLGPAFTVRGMVVWGFTAGVLTTVLELAGWARPWDPERIEDLPPEQLESIRPAQIAQLGGGAAPGAAPVT
ncbi:MAG: NUDIX domain-containing protein [Micromonosporaceae bacterium]|nr:NUDIX domain-containing protein [Micromonosporaceae bacterium]